MASDNSNSGSYLSGTWDGLQYAYTPLTGDGSIIARISGFGATYTSSDAGIMLRTGPTPTSAMMFTGIENSALVVKWRTATGLTDQVVSGAPIVPPYWFKLVRIGATISAWFSPNGVDWVQAGATPTFTDLGSVVYAGVAVSGAGSSPYNTATGYFDHVNVNGNNGSSTPDFMLAPPTSTQLVTAGESVSVPVTVTVTGQFTGAVALSVDPASLPSGMSASFGPATVTGAGESTLILTAGPSTTGTFMLTINGVSGNLSHSTSVQVTISAAAQTPATIPATTPASGTGGSFTFSATDPGGNGANISWMEVLLNGSLSGSQACYLHYDRTAQMLYLRDDTNPSWAGSVAMPMASGTSLVNSQCTVTGAAATVTAGTLSLTATLNFTRAFAGLQTIYEIADEGNLNSGWETVGAYTATVAAGTLPTNWNSTGLNGAGGSTSYSNGNYTLTNGAAVIGGTADGLQLAYVPLVGDGTLVARLASYGASYSSSDAGIMLRTGPTPTAAMMFVGIENSAAMVKWRTDTGLTAQSWTPAAGSAGNPLTAPRWLCLTRSGNIITAFISANGLDWTQIQQQTLNILPGSTMYAALAVAGAGSWPWNPASATFDNVATGTPDFALLGPSGTQNLLAGSTGSFQITVNPILVFFGAVSLSVDPSSVPAGTTATFTPAAITAHGTSTLTILLPSGTTGTIQATIIGSSGSLSHTVTVPITVEPGGASSFSAYRSITIDHTKVGTVNQTDQVNFPVAVSGLYSYLASTANGGKVRNSSGYDIVFASDSAGTTLLNWEIEKYDPATGTLAAWVKVANVSHASDTVIYMFYGNSGISHFYGGAPGTVWDQNFTGVWHFGNGATLSGPDATNNANNASISGAAATTGVVGGGASFGGSQAMSVASNPTIKPTRISVSFWFKRNSGSQPNYGRLFEKGTDANGAPYGSYEANFNGTDSSSAGMSIGFTDGTTDGWSTPSGGIAANTWYQMAITYDGSVVAVYKNGLQQYSHANTRTLFSDNYPLAFGANNNNFGGFGEYFSGQLDELRLSNTARTADWISTEYNNQSSPAAFYTVGGEMMP